MMASAPGCHGQSTDLQTRARAPAEGMPVDFPARQRAVRSTDLESCSSGLKSRGPKSARTVSYSMYYYYSTGTAVLYSTGTVLRSTGTAVLVLYLSTIDRF